MKKRVVITGLGVVSSIGIGLDEFTAALKSGKSGAGRITHFDPSAFTTQFGCEVKNFDPFAYIDRKKVRKMDKFVQFCMAAAKMALEDSGLDLTTEAEHPRIGVIIGSGIGGMSTIEAEHKVLMEKGPSRVSPFLVPMQIINIAPAEVAINWKLTGPNYGVVSACASSNHAIGDALRMLRYGDADVIVTGGTEYPITPLGLAGFCSVRALSQSNDNPEKASRPFDKDRNGFVMAEGSGVIILETLEHALGRGARIYAELCGYGATDDAFHITAPHPDANAAIRAMKLAIGDAEIDASQVDYVNAHGTSTELNDKIETTAIKNVFGKRAYEIPVSSTKSMTGHVLGAAGAVELIATIMCMKNGFIHPTINYNTPDPECDLDYVPNTPREKQITCALSNSLGFGGHNAVLIVKKYIK